VGKRGAVRGGAAPRASFCDHPRCGGVFCELVDELAYQRSENYTCDSCGAAAHWERAAIKAPRHRFIPPKPDERQPSNDLWIGMGFRGYRPDRVLYVVATAQEIPAGDPHRQVLDVDGTPIRDLLGERSKTIFDIDTVPPLVRTFYVVDAIMASRTHFRDLLVERREGFRAHLERETIDLENARRQEFLWEGGWFIEKAGATGQPVGRPKEGLRGEHLEQALEALYTDPGYCLSVWDLADKDADGAIVSDSIGVKLSRPHLTLVRRQVVRHVPNANTQALADHFGITSRAVRLLKAVRSANSPNSEGTTEGDMSTTNTERIESKLDALRAEMRVEHDELFRVLWAFRHGETPVEAWERLLADDDEAA
jgi:hypothetical protein